jgi:hypothetical protein
LNLSYCEGITDISNLGNVCKLTTIHCKNINSKK